MAKLTEEEKSARKRQRMIEKAKEYQTTTYVRKFVAPLFQRMIRAEWGADERPFHTAVVDGSIRQVERRIGQCACITCGKVGPWIGGSSAAGGGMNTGHFIASRRNSILFEEDNVAPQCAHCNLYLSGNPQEYRKWMLAVRGLETVERLEQLKTESVSFIRDDLVDMRIAYADRLKAAEDKMKEPNI